MKYIEQNIRPVISTLTIMMVLFVARQEFHSYISLREKELKVMAINECAKTASSTWNDPKFDSKVTEPYKPAYDQCLKDKGY